MKDTPTRFDADFTGVGLAAPGGADNHDVGLGGSEYCAARCQCSPPLSAIPFFRAWPSLL